MHPELFHRLSEEGGCVDWSARTKLQLRGADRLRYLNGQITNDARKARADETLYACVTSAKGRVQADVFVRAAEDALWLDAAPDLREKLLQRLERYVVADDVEILDVTEEWRLWHCFGPLAEAVRTAPPEGAVAVVASNRLGAPGVDVWLSASQPLPSGFDLVLSAEEVEEYRILQGVPAWPRELNEETFPQEAGLEDRAMDFHKGCYIGQEVLSRIKMTGKMPRTLVRFQVSTTLEVSPEDWDKALVWTRQEVGTVKEVGAVTSACLHPLLDRWVGLAYVRQAVGAEHSLLLAGPEAHTLFGQLDIIS